MDVEGEGAGANREGESINEPILGVEESVDDNLQQSYFNNNIGGVDSNSNNNNGGGSGNETVAHMPDHFDLYRPGQRFKCSEETLKNNIVAVLSPYGCRRLVLGQGSRANKDENTKLMFPHKRWNWACGSCSIDDREKNDDALGCCGIKVRLLLVDNDPESDPYIEVREFKIPPTSKHLRVSQEARAASESKVITNEDMLSPKKTALLMNLGKSRTNYHTVETILSDQS